MTARPPSISRAARIRQVERAVGRRTVVWFGGRGVEAEALLALPQFAESYALSAALGSSQLTHDFSLERLTLERADHRTYEIERDRPDAVRQLRDALRASFAKPTLLVSVRPSAFLASAYVPRLAQVEYAGLFHEHQRAFEHKPWVEMEFARAGIRTVPWEYVATDDLDGLLARDAGRAFVLRGSHSNAGAGFHLVLPGESPPGPWPAEADGYVSVAPYLDRAIPICVNAALFADGSVSLHPSSLQLIGIPALTLGAFGYAGNDFARIADLGDAELDEIEDIVRRAGIWLARHGYVGAFGVDLLVDGGEVHVTEVNPRFQSSSPLAARLDAAMDRSDLYLEHLAAFLGLEPVPGPSLRDLVRSQPGRAQLMAYSTASEPRRLRSSPPIRCDWSFEPEVLPPPEVRVLRGGVLARLMRDGPVTADGLSLIPGLADEAEAFLASRFEPAD